MGDDDAGRIANVPWRGWYHVNGNTYGTWLRGSALGFRSRRHSDHVEGDYRHPPRAGRYDRLRAQVRASMKRPAVTLSEPARRLACEAMAASLSGDGIDVAALAVDGHHFHVLARFVDHAPRRWIGLAKRRSALALVKAGHAQRGGVWAVRCRCLPVRDRLHQVNVARYIAAHEKHGAAV